MSIILASQLKFMYQGHLRRNSMVKVCEQLVCVVQYIFLLLKGHRYRVLVCWIKSPSPGGNLCAVTNLMRVSVETPKHCESVVEIQVPNLWTYSSWPASRTASISLGNVSRLWPTGNGEDVSDTILSTHNTSTHQEWTMSSWYRISWKVSGDEGYQSLLQTSPGIL